MIVGITGQARHGKDTVASYFVNQGYTRMAFADPLRELAEYIDPIVRPDLGWGNRRYTELLRDVGYDVAKESEEFRRFLQQLGTGVREVLGDDTWVDALDRKMWQMLPDDEYLDPGDVFDIVVPDVRFPNEAEFIKYSGGVLLKVVRPGFDNGVDESHPSERFVKDLDANLVVMNDGDETDLAIKMPGIIREIEEMF